MSVDFAHILETDPSGEHSPAKGQIFGIVLIFFRLRIRERCFVKRIVDFQRFVSLPFGNVAEYLVQLFLRYLPGVFRYTCGSKYIAISDTFSLLRRCGRLCLRKWNALASMCHDDMAAADNFFTSFAGRFTLGAPPEPGPGVVPQTDYHPYGIYDGKGRQEYWHNRRIHRRRRLRRDFG